MPNINEILEDLYEGFLAFRHNRIAVVFDKNTQSIWFDGINAAIATGHKNPRHALFELVDPENRMRLSDIDANNKHGNPKSIYVNLAGLFSLILRSRHNKAIAFKNFMLQEAFPGFLKFRIYRRIREAERLLHKIARKINKIIRKINDGSSSNGSNRLENLLRDLTRRHDDLIRELVILNELLRAANDI